MSASLAAVPTTVCTTPEATSTPICAFIPKCHWLPFLVWCISGSRAFSLFLVEAGAAMIVASTMVLRRISNPRSASNLVDHRLGQPVTLRPVAEVQQRRRVGHRVAVQVDAGKAVQRL